MANPVSRRGIRSVLALGLLIVLLVSRMQAAFWQNTAQLQRLRGNNTQAASASMWALALVPYNAHIRWRAGEALVQAGDNDAAVTTLLPLAGQALDPLITDLLFMTLIDAGREDDALRLYASWTPLPFLHPEAASVLALQYVQQSRQLSPAQATALLAQALELDLASPEFQMLAEQLADPNVWATDVGQRVYEVLVWHSQGQTPESMSIVGEPDHQRVVEILDVTPTDVQFGEELVENGGFEKRYLMGGMPLGWWPMFWTAGNCCNRATFIIGTDSDQPFAGNHSLRIDGLQIERLPEFEPARVGIWHETISFKPRLPYVVSFVYRTTPMDDPGASILLMSGSQVLFDSSFPATQGQWKRVIIVIWNQSDTNAHVAPLLRSLGEGSVWFDNFSVREVILNPQLFMPSQDALVLVDDVMR